MQQAAVVVAAVGVVASQPLQLGDAVLAGLLLLVDVAGLHL